MQELPEGVVPGALVHARGARWRVRDTRCGGTAALVTLEGLDQPSHGRVSTLLVPMDRVWPIRIPAPVRRQRQRVIRRMLHTIGLDRPARGLWTAAAANIDMLEWQLAPVLAVLGDGATRLLLADAVGLGKTVQAGLILAELRARGLVDRAMVLAPAALRAQWVDELGRRFALPAHVLDAGALLEIGQAGPAGANPWARAPIIVTSIDLVKRAEVRAAVEHAPIDLLIVDEAHHATPGTDRHAIVSRLAQQAAWVVLITATPHSGDAASHDALLAIGADSSGQPMRVFRRHESDVAALVPRRTRVWRVQQSGPEVHLQIGVLAYARAVCQASSAHAGAQLFAATIARRATSSPRAARLTLERRLAWLRGELPAETPRLQPLPWEETESDDGDPFGIGVPGFADRRAERDALVELIDRARTAERAPSKLARLLQFLRRVREPVIVFSEFRDTLDACREAIEANTSVAVLHGALDVAERQQQLARFVNGQARVLLATDVAGEGLNLHHAARIVLTLEWPWSPLRLEQRIGRVHRLGQRRVVHAVHLTAASSYEEIVVEHLRQRAACAEEALRDAGSVERRVAAAVLELPVEDEGVSHADPVAAAHSAIEDRARGEAERVRRARWLMRFPSAGLHEPAWALPRRRSWSDQAVVLIEVMHHRAGGGPSSACVVPVGVMLATSKRDVRWWRARANRLCRDSRVHQAAAEAVAAQSNGEQWSAVRERMDSLWERGRLPAPLPLVQPSLFDRRAVRAAEHQQHAHAAHQQWRAGLRTRLAETPLSVTTRAIAVLAIGGPDR